MTRIDTDTVDIFDRTLRGVLAGRDVDVDATSALVEVGWRDFLAVEPAQVVPLVFHHLGELVLPSTALDDVALAALHPDGAAHFGDDVAVAHPRAGVAGGRVARTELVVDALVLGGRQPASLVVVAVTGDGLRVVTLPDLDGLEAVAVDGIDPALGLVRVRGAVNTTHVVMADDLDAGAVAIACRRALAYELIGLTDRMLEMATDYAKVRTQFGQPIGAFQAVKHRVADVLVAARAARVVVDESWSSDPDVMTIAAKCLAAGAAAIASQNCLQVLGAIGFTLEHDLHRFVRRAKVLDRLYGSERELRAELGDALRARATMPRPGTFSEA
jgi:hypothetical protein